MIMEDLQTNENIAGSVIFRGNFYPESKTIDMKGEVQLTKQHSRSLIKAATPLKKLSGADGRIGIPILVKGSFEKPKVLLDKKSLGKIL